MAFAQNWYFFIPINLDRFLTDSQATRDTESILKRIITMLRDLAHDMDIFQIYESIFADTNMENDIVDVFKKMINWEVFSIEFFRNNSLCEFQIQ